MAFGEIDVLVRESESLDALDIYFHILEGPDTVRIMRPFVKENKFTWEWTAQLTSDPLGMPSIRIPRMLNRMAIVQKLVDSIHEVTGVKPTLEKEDPTEVGRLEKHIEDLQKILFGYDYASFERGQPVFESASRGEGSEK